MIKPERTELTAPYWAGAERGEVMLQRCLECGLIWHPPAPTCPGGVTHRIEWFAAAGQGRLHSYTQIEHAAHPAVQESLPYLVGLVELAEGPRLICNMLDFAADDLTPGRALTLSLGPAAGGLALLVAYPA